MRSFLGVSNTQRGEGYGSVYLAESTNGGFTEQDATVLEFLAATAAIIENARLSIDARSRHDWPRASTEITRTLLTRSDHSALGDIAQLVKTMADADVVKVVLPTEDGHQLRINVALGEGGEVDLSGRVYPVDGTLSQATIESGEPMRLANAEDVASLEVHFSDGVRVGR